ncbi:hypothetical protein NRB20_17440 [Nocardia sp. RB20]|uniref:Sulfotransferase n=1 Tax=Nocardia macrotermitis TaxID=2585198 RepID=A0A7K0CYU9_9NOCA|nr:hypothetical protein [Nocardia macrotermitis]
MQRLITSHPEAFIWGEQHGQFGAVVDAFEGLVGHNESYGGAGRTEFELHGYQGFLANLMPETEHMREAFAEFCTRLFQVPDVRVWGFKEVRFDLAFATRLQRYLPGLRVIFIVRDPRDVLSSLDEWESRGWWTRADTEMSFRNWTRIAHSFLETGSVPVLSVRYEDFIADREDSARRVAEFADLDPDGFDMAVFDRKVHNLGLWEERTLRTWEEMSIDLRYLLFDEGLRATAKAYDYHL